jgi:hypothetical protein
LGTPTYRAALLRWLAACDIRDDTGQPVHLTPHRWRHTLGTRLINRDVPQEVVRRILDHDSPQMTAHYARMHDTTVRRAWEAARKVDITGCTVVFDPDGALADAVWAKQRLTQATQALPNGYCGLPLQQSCPHANATNLPVPKPWPPCTNSTAPANPSLSAPSPTPQASPVPGSTPRPTSKTRSGACAPATSPGRPQRFRPGNKPATNPCASASTSRYAATANSPTKTSGYAANSPSLSARTATRHPNHIAIG